MTRIYSPFKVLVCPVCGTCIRSGPRQGKLVAHIQHKHKDIPRMSIILAMEEKLKISPPTNLDSLSTDELDLYLESLCQYKATTEGLRQLRKHIREGQP
jgi:hypothetical protein